MSNAEAPKGGPAQAEAPKTPLPKPEEIQEKAIFIGEGKPVEEKPKVEKKVKEQGKEPKKVPIKEAATPAKLVIQEAMAKDSLMEQVFSGKPIKSPEVEEFIAERLSGGKGLVEIGRDLNENVYWGKFTGPIESFEAMKVLNKIQQATGVEFQVTQPYEAGAWQFYDNTNPGSAQSDDVKDELQKIQDQIDLDQELLKDPQFYNDVANDLRKKSLPAAEVKPYIQKLRTEQADVVKNMRGRDRFSSMFLSDIEKDALNDNPEWKVEQEVRKIERKSRLFAGDTAGANAALRRLELMSEYFSHDQFIKDIKDYVDDHPTKFPTPQAKQDHIDRMMTISDKLSEKVSFRKNIQSAYGMIRGLGDPDKVSGSLLGVGEAGFEFLLNENGGLVDVAFNKYVQVYKQARFDRNGNLRRYTGPVLEEVKRITVVEMKRDKTLYNDMYRNAFGQDITDVDCEAIVSLAEFAAVISQQNLVAELGGLGPGEVFGPDAQSSFTSSSTSEKVLGAMDIQRWFFEKWWNQKPAQRIMWENGCRFAAQTSGRTALVNEKLKNVRLGDPRFMELAEEAFGENSAGSLKRALEYDAAGHQRKHLPKNFNELSIKDLQDRLYVVEGEKVIGEMLTVYDHFSSGWRLNTHLQKINEIWGNNEGGRLGLGFRLRKAGMDLLGAESLEAKRDAIEKIDPITGNRSGLKPTLELIARYRPQALFEFLNDGKYQPAKDWLTPLQARFSNAFGEPVTRVDQVYKLVGRRFIAINEILAQAELPPIDYSVGPTPQQRVVVDRVCAHMGTDAVGYLSLMREMSSFVGQDIQIHELTKEQYMPVYRRTRWLDDSRLRQLEHPEDLLGAVPIPPGDYRLGLSAQFAYLGMGGDVDPFVRSWRDTGVAVKTVLEVYASFTADRKALSKALLTINANVRQYSGEPYGSRAVFYLLAGWGKTAKTDAIKDFFFLNVTKDSSAAKRLLGDEAPSLGLNELEHLIDEYDVALMSKMKLLAPEMSKDFEKYLGLTGIIGETKLPLFIYRARLFIVLATVLIMLQAVKSADQEISGK